ncbi:MAG TPA: lysophospholipid acyltransferase family protein [Candidatus Hydrogenedentes bacterium]|nr:lysophospholipid acyltransferase family protein [Candidatus Hydrogenedentota bacterium]HNT88594.1 lysophospholipid acyltransferase family protein [Candidatus Hydrogenedentota bacterium]
MGFLRALSRYAFLTVWSVAFALVYGALWPFTRRPESRRRALRRAMLKAWAGGMTRAFGIRIEIHGPVPQTPFFLVANHLSYLDILVLERCTGCVFVARGDVASWLVIGGLLKSIHMIFINRADKRDTVRVNELIHHALVLNDCVGVFAESRISRGIDVEPFKSALIQPAIANGVPIHYATVSYKSLPGATPAWEVVNWWQPIPFFTHLWRLLAARGVLAVIRFGEEPLTGNDRKALAQELHAAVRARFVPVQ